MKVGIEVEGLREVLTRLNKLGPDLNREVRVSSKEIAEEEAGRIRSAAGGSGDVVSAAVGATVRARSDRLPSIVGGGARRLHQLSGKPRLSDVFFGAEYGGGKRATTRQFRPHKGKVGYWFWPQIREDQELMLQEWAEALDRVLNGSGS